MRLLRVCCCGCTLRTGSIIIGSLSLIGSVASMILMIVAIPAFQSLEANANDRVLKYEAEKISTYSGGPDSRFIMKSNIGVEDEITPNLSDLMDTSSYRNDEIYHRMVISTRYNMNMLITYMVGSSISVIVSILLLIGAAKGYMWLLLPWIAYMSLSIIVAIVSSIFQLVALSSIGASGGSIFLGVILVAGILVLYIYLLMVVVSHFEEMRKSKIEGQSNLGQIYSAPNPWFSSNANILPNLPEKEGA